MPLPDHPHRHRHVVGRPVLRDEAGGARGLGRLRRDPAGARDQQHARARRLAPDRLAELRARLLAEEEVHERDVRLVAARHLERLLHVRRGQAALDPRLLGQQQAEAPVDDVVVVHHQHAQVALGAHSADHPPAARRAARASRRPRARTPRAPRAGAPRPRPAAGPCRRRGACGSVGAPSFRTSSRKVPSMRPTCTRTEVGLRVLVRVAERLGQHRLGERLDVLGHLHPLLPVELERQVLVVAAEPRELVAQGGAGVERSGGASGRESASRRSASAACISSAQRRRASSLSACSEPSTSETPNSRCTTRSWSSRARSMRAWSSRARPCWFVAMRTLAASAAVLPSVHIVVALGVGQLEAGRRRGRRR